MGIATMVADSQRREPPALFLPGMPCQRVLCWVGLHDEPDHAVPVARALAAQSRGQCHLVLCLDAPSPLTPELITRAKRELAALYGDEARTIVLPGRPVREVARYARNHEMDLVVMGEQASEVERRCGERFADLSPCTVMILLRPASALQLRASSNRGDGAPASTNSFPER